MIISSIVCFSHTDDRGADESQACSALDCRCPSQREANISVLAAVTRIYCIYHNFQLHFANVVCSSTIFSRTVINKSLGLTTSQLLVELRTTAPLKPTFAKCSLNTASALFNVTIFHLQLQLRTANFLFIPPIIFIKKSATVNVEITLVIIFKTRLISTFQIIRNILKVTVTVLTFMQFSFFSVLFILRNNRLYPKNILSILIINSCTMR